jgi:hypothetical protein
MNYRILIIALLGFGFMLNPQTKKVTETFFQEVELDIHTPAFNKTRGFTKYDDMMAFLKDLESRYPNHMTISYLGSSQKGKQIPKVVLKTASSQNPVRIWMQGGLHGNEPASTEGMLYLIEQLLLNQQYLENAEIAIVPMANIDGYEIQNRYAANGLDLNRDQTKLNIKESISLKRAFSDFSAEVAVDFHEYRPYRRDFVHFGKEGITSRFDVMFLYSGNLNVPVNLRKYTQDVFVNAARKSLDIKGLKHHDYVTSHKHYGDIHFNQGSVNSRSSATSYALTNCVSSLIEVRGVGLGRTSFKRRVMSTYEVAMAYITTAIQEKGILREQLALSRASEHNVVVTSKRKVSKEKLLVIDLNKTEEKEIEVTLRDALNAKAELVRSRPLAYVLTNQQDQKQLVYRLNALGISFRHLCSDTTVRIEEYTPTSVYVDGYPYEGTKRQEIKTEVEAKTRTIAANSLWISMNQKNANLLVELMEPEAKNSMVAFGIIKVKENKPLNYYRVIK